MIPFTYQTTLGLTAPEPCFAPPTLIDAPYQLGLHFHTELITDVMNITILNAFSAY